MTAWAWIRKLWITFTKDIRWIITPTVLGYIMSRKDFSFIMGTSMELFMKANQVKELLPQLQYRDNRRGCDEKYGKWIAVALLLSLVFSAVAVNYHKTEQKDRIVFP